MPTLKKDLETVTLLTEKVNLLCDQLGIKTTAGRNFVFNSLANALLMDQKQQDYGSRNISGFGTFGVVVRMNDKFERLKSLFNKGRRRRAVNESIIDTFRDISNYATIALMIETNQWRMDETSKDEIAKEEEQTVEEPPF